VDTTPGHNYSCPVIHIAQGTEDRCILTYGSSNGAPRAANLHAAWSPLNVPEADFSVDTIVFSDSNGIEWPDITTDAIAFTDYYAYLVFGAGGQGEDIYFCRSVDGGTTWEDPYVIGEITYTDRSYVWPTVVFYGYGGYVHVSWVLAFHVGHDLDDAVRYRRTASYGDGGSRRDRGRAPYHPLGRARRYRLPDAQRSVRSCPQRARSGRASDAAPKDHGAAVGPTEHRAS